jgi:multiple sugar transport system permease protein
MDARPTAIPTSSGAPGGRDPVLLVLRYAVLLFLSALFIFPFLWMVTTALKELPEAMRIPPQWIPDPFRWDNFMRATEAIPFWLYSWNTLVLCVLNVAGTTLSCSLAAYGFSRIEWRGRDKFFAITLATMMVPFPVLMVPLYSIFRELGWIGSFKPLWVPAFFGSAYNIFLLRQFFLTIPKELSEAARIDGCSELRIFSQIILPLSKPALLVVGLFCFMYVWNDFMGPLIYLTNPEHFTLALGLQAFQSKLGGTDINLLMAASTLMILPIVVLFFLMQRTFIEGISLTGLKG